MTAVKHVLQHVVLFSMAKSMVLFAPLFAAAILSSAQYGSVEWWLSLSMTLGPLVGAGGHTLVAYGTLGGGARRYMRTAVVFVLQISCVLILLATGAHVFGPGWGKTILGPVCMFSAVVCLQLTLAARLKGLGKGAWASLAESSVYLALLIALLGKMVGLDFMLTIIVASTLIAAALILSLLRFVRLPSIATWWKRNYSQGLIVGYRFAMGSVLIGLFMAGPRIFLGFGDPESVARFALIFRWLSASIAIHQFLNTVFFRELYGASELHKRDRALSRTIALVALFSLVIALFLRFGGHLFAFLPVPRSSDSGLVWAISAAMVLWSTTACLEGTLFKLDAAARQIKSVLFGLASFCLIGMVGKLFITDLVVVLTAAWLTGFSTMIFVQFRTLRSLGFDLPRTRGFCMAGTGVIMVCAITNHYF